MLLQLLYYFSLNWLLWHTDAYTRQLHRTLLRNSTSHLLSRLVRVSDLLQHHRLLSNAPVFQPSAIELFWSLHARLWNTLPLSVTSASSISSSVNIWRPISSVIHSLNLLWCLCSDFVIISDTNRFFFTYFFFYLGCNCHTYCRNVGLIGRLFTAVYCVCGLGPGAWNGSVYLS